MHQSPTTRSLKSTKATSSPHLKGCRWARSPAFPTGDGGEGRGRSMRKKESLLLGIRPGAPLRAKPLLYFCSRLLLAECRATMIPLSFIDHTPSILMIVNKSKHASFFHAAHHLLVVAVLLVVVGQGAPEGLSLLRALRVLLDLYHLHGWLWDALAVKNCPLAGVGRLLWAVLQGLSPPRGRRVVGGCFEEFDVVDLLDTLRELLLRQISTCILAYLL